MAEKHGHTRTVIRKPVPADLLDAIYKAEGWTRGPGEVRSRRASSVYDITCDPRKGVYIATPRASNHEDTQ